MADYSDVRTMLDEVTELLVQNRGRLTTAESGIATAEAELAGIATKYEAALAHLAAVIAADPENEAYIIADAQRVELTREFLALKARATAMREALAAL